MKNIDKIKSLKNQNEALMRQKANLREDRIQAMKALEEIEAIHTAVMISIAIAYGSRDEQGSFTLTVPKIDVDKNIAEYKVKASADGDIRTIIVSPREKDDKQRTVHE